MKITNYKFFDLIEIKNFEPETLVVENPTIYRKMVEEIISEFNYDVGDFVISESDDKPLEFSKNCIVINDFYNSGINNKSFKTKLLNAISSDYRYLFEDSALLLQLNDLALEISNSFPFDITYNSSFGFADIVKMLDFRFDIDGDEFWDRFLQKIAICKEMLSYKLVVTINLKDNISKEEYDELIKNLKYRETQILMIERNVHGDLDDCNHTKIIDKDLCVI